MTDTPQLRAPVERWLTIVGVGEDGWIGLSAEAKEAVASAEVVYGGARHLALLPGGTGVRQCWPSPMASAVARILTEDRGCRRVAVLASGDPMLYGVGVTLTLELPAAEFHVIPQISAMSLACARLGWAAAETTLLSLVHRPIEQVRRVLWPGERLIVYSEDGSTPAAVARLLTACGFGTSTMTVLEHLGGTAERRIARAAGEWCEERCADLNVIAVHCAADAEARVLSPVTGLPDSAYANDGQLTKREVRAVTLARLAPLPRQMLWDVGAGSGSIGIEWMRAHPTCRAIAFEAQPERAERIRANARCLGVPGLQVVEGRAPGVLAGVPMPDAVFVGGGLSEEGVFASCWGSLRGGGRFVATAVTLASEAKLLALHEEHGGELVRIGIERAESIGKTVGWRPLMPVTQWSVVKP